MKRHTLIAGGLVALGLVALLAAIASNTSVRSYVKDNYEAAGTRTVQGSREPSLLYDSSKAPTATANDIADAVSPGDRRVTPSGVFLRYSDDIVTVVPRSGGSRVIVEDEDTGYRSGYGYIGGFWGTYSGRGESFRGGGPGSGK